MQNENREMVHNGKSRPTFDLYSSPSSNPRKLPLQAVSWPIRFAHYPSAELLTCGIVRKTWPGSSLVVTLRILHARRKWGEQVNRTSLKTGETWSNICGRSSMYAKRKYLAIIDQSTINVIGLSSVMTIYLVFIVIEARLKTTYIYAALIIFYLRYVLFIYMR